MESPATWLLFLACAFGAQVIGTMAGFGAATVLTPVAFLFMEAKTAIAIVACFHLFANGSRLLFFVRHVSWSTWARFGLVAVVFGLLGAAAAVRLSSEAIELVFGAFLLLYVGVSIVAPQRLRLPHGSGTLVAGGILSGFIAGLLGIGGAIRSACLLAFGLPREVYLGTSAAIALVVDATRVPVYVVGGFIPSRLTAVLVSLIGVAVAGAWLGRRLVTHLPAAAFRWFVLTLLGLMGLKLLLEGWPRVA